MFERFTEASRAVLTEAEGVAVELGSGHLGIGHLLYGCAEVRDDTAGRPLRDAGITGELVRRTLPRTAEAAAEPIDADALRALGIDYDEIRAAVENAHGPGALDRAPDRRRPGAVRRPRFTVDAVETLKGSLIEARELRAKRLRPGHLLLGVLRVDDPAVNDVLERAGTTAAELRPRVVASLAAEE